MSCSANAISFVRNLCVTHKDSSGYLLLRRAEGNERTLRQAASPAIRARTKSSGRLRPPKLTLISYINSTLLRDGPWSYCNSYSYVTLSYGNYELKKSVTGACNSEARTNVVLVV
jgi:hypothetical protein